MNKKKISMTRGVHLINEQLQIIRSSVEHLVMISDITDEMKVYLDNIVNAVDKCSDLIRMKIDSEDKNVELDSKLLIKKRGAKILIIEDEVSVAEIYKSNLEYFGFEVFVSKSFIEGVKILNSRDIDIVVLDIMLPDAYGLDCVDVIKSKKADIKIVIATGKLDELKQDLTYLDNKCTILTKPFSIRELLAAVL